ncbi:MAG: CopG family transcriptional regulator [Candidatus Terraquivivens tikiterensis]|uniref:CopG family transcriptional regulator n=1 Tax=Candidatus Terraquivivens tikiterensis TaxID=1980982 RepID=A0A2R7Y277_9ARCH|nr:MAG: CopG family transcriptional regulator [Candidatus Terraquivivens tikiterensis]
MSEVFSIRISKDVKKKMELLKDVVDWNEEVRRFIESRVDEFYRSRVIEEVRSVIMKLPETPRGSVTRYVREDRDSY